MINDKTWNMPVTLVIGSAKYLVTSSREAAWMLADKWPDVTGNTFIRALRACTAAIEGKRPNSFARQAFVVAARRANIIVEG